MTDTKAVARWDFVEHWARYVQNDGGDYVLFTDHERVVGELNKARDAERLHWVKFMDMAKTELAASRAEVALKAAIAARQPGAQDDWMPMESAPKDGTYIMLSNEGQDIVLIGTWHRLLKAWTGYPTTSGQHLTWKTATHWKHLPAPVGTKRYAAHQPTNQCDGCLADMPVENGIHRNATSDFHGIHMACQADKYSIQPVAWQMRTDERHNGFDDDKWMEIPRDEYEAYKRVMGGNGPKSLAGTTERGDLRIDDGGWMIELRQLFDSPPAQENANVSTEPKGQEPTDCNHRGSIVGSFGDSAADSAPLNQTPAQGIDLGQFRPAVKAYLFRQREFGSVAGISEGERLLALIDQLDKGVE